MSSDLFSDPEPAYQPLAARVRPQTLADYYGQQHLLGAGKPLREAVERGQLHSMVLWGPPGVGKTTLARMLAATAEAHFIALSAVLSGVKEIREAVAQAQDQRSRGRATILFVDEVHRFNKSQQDAFLPYVEDGTLIFVGATTENPSFELNNALLSRSRVYKLRNLDTDELCQVLDGALATLGTATTVSPDNLRKLALSADGDARRALNLLELALDLSAEGDLRESPAAANDSQVIDEAIIEEVLQGSLRRFDKGGDLFYDQISALHKAVRGSSPDAALYWFARMLDGGCDPLYLARRVVRMASEDIGNADPRGLSIALDAWQVQERLGSPEGELALAQAISYLASAAKSNAVYSAWKAAVADVESQPGYEVPMHLRNAPTELMKSFGHGEEYRYAHDEPGGFAAGENYFPPELRDRVYYHPTDRGLEQRIADKLASLREQDKNSTIRRYENPADSD
ncbi:replication-associated recombination protein A [Halieaceae bacterium IMCC14734]|uniref:Replication-associated recombination protein A n=1 Tax=Candidatus Litorirhabdus singularis TaxID=2518993 RepID=A0ABT3TG28_9GAMM|nr:replication-associated recombination protein A [Candidatus Litorirhabdus singularis]MCX2981243.1 replication-associated recombination protein A [Candidatus Litorirhabdus singularis]